MSSPVEDIATTIAASVRANGWEPTVYGAAIYISANGWEFCNLFCKDAQEALRLAEMMRKPAEPVFDAMGLSPFPTFPSVRTS